VTKRLRNNKKRLFFWHLAVDEGKLFLVVFLVQEEGQGYFSEKTAVTTSMGMHNHPCLLDPSGVLQEMYLLDRSFFGKILFI
jgi:hypothetical protein